MKRKSFVVVPKVRLLDRSELARVQGGKLKEHVDNPGQTPMKD